MAYIHVEVDCCQSAKRAGAPCGDLFRVIRSPAATTLICCDGVGSGTRGNLAANWCVGRLAEMLRPGSVFSLREAFARTGQMMNDIRQGEPAYPFAAFAVGRILNDGSTTVLGYEMPPPLVISGGRVTLPPQRTLSLARSAIGEATCELEPGDALLLTSDGITQAGLGGEMPMGWTADGVRKFAGDLLARGTAAADLPRLIDRRARQLCGGRAGDDCTTLLATCRVGRVVNVLTGPPVNPANDAAVVREFMSGPGAKVVCGATTSSIVGRELDRPVEIESRPVSLIAPPRYLLEGVDLVTEGAVTLNQVCNVLGEDLRKLEAETGVSELCKLLWSADRVNFFVGLAANPANSDISFRQRGIIGRRTVVPLLADKLQTAGKLVVIRHV